MTADLLLHWQLDQVAADGVLLDSSPGVRNGVVEGQPRAQADEMFGSCLILDGRTDALAAAAPVLRLGTYTIAVWATLPRPTPVSTQAVLYVLAAQTGGPSLAVSTAGAFVHEVVTGAGARHSFVAPVGSLDWAAWHHLAITSDGTTARTFVDGSEVAHWSLDARPAESQGDLVVGSDPLRRTHAAGRFAHLRVYAGALTEAELRRDMADDEAALAAFVRAHPLDIALTNSDDQPVLYIDDGPATQQLTLRLTNSSRQDVELRPGTGPVSAQNHHVALLFRPGTLAAAAAPATSAPGWTIQRDPDGTTLYLLRSDAPVTIARGGWLEVPISGLNADGAGGSRGTRVEADFGQLGYSGEQEELTGSRLLFLDVVNHRGRPDIPLNASFVGGDRVLSTGHTAGILRIRLSTVSRDTGIALAGTATAGDAASAFAVSFDGQEVNESREWALTTSGRAGDVHLALPTTGAGSNWAVTPDDLGQRRRWILTPRTDTAIPADGDVELVLSDIYALGTPGHAPVVVEYKNIPGYRDGFVSLAAERTPLLFSASAVGIGQAAGASRLTVSAGSGHLQLRRESTAPGTGAQQYLELFQDDTAAETGTTFPCIGFNHSGRFVHRIEARPEGITFKDGPVTNDTLLDVYAGRLVLGPKLGGVRVQAGQPLTTPALTVGAESAHVQLRRESAARTGNQLYLELFQDATPDGKVSFPSIRFHQSMTFWHRIEGRPEGFAFKDGDLTSDALADIRASTATLSSIRIGAITIGESELRILQLLASGKLRFDLYNPWYEQYAMVFARTTAKEPFVIAGLSEPDGNGLWQIVNPRT